MLHINKRCCVAAAVLHHMPSAIKVSDMKGLAPIEPIFLNSRPNAWHTRAA